MAQRTLFFLQVVSLFFVSHTSNAQMFERSDTTLKFNLCADKNIVVNFQSGTQIYFASDTSFLVFKSPNPNHESEVIYILYDKAGQLIRNFVGPDLSNVLISKDGRIAIFGTYWTMSVAIKTFVYLYDKGGNVTYKSENGYGPQLHCQFINNEDYFLIVAGSTTSTFVSDTLFVFVFDSKFNLNGKGTFPTKLRAKDETSSLSFDLVDEAKKEIHLHYLTRKKPNSKKLLLDYTCKKL